MRNRSLLGLSVGLMAAAAFAAPSVQERDSKRQRITIVHEPLPLAPRLRPSPTPKKGKPTKAEKKAAKRARTRGVTGLRGPNVNDSPTYARPPAPPRPVGMSGPVGGQQHG